MIKRSLLIRGFLIFLFLFISGFFGVKNVEAFSQAIVSPTSTAPEYTKTGAYPIHFVVWSDNTDWGYFNVGVADRGTTICGTSSVNHYYTTGLNDIRYSVPCSSFPRPDGTYDAALAALPPYVGLITIFSTSSVIVDHVQPTGLRINAPSDPGILLKGGTSTDITWDTPNDNNLGS